MQGTDCGSGSILKSYESGTQNEVPVCRKLLYIRWMDSETNGIGSCTWYILKMTRVRYLPHCFEPCGSFYDFTTSHTVAPGKIRIPSDNLPRRNIRDTEFRISVYLYGSLGFLSHFLMLGTVCGGQARNELGRSIYLVVLRYALRVEWKGTVRMYRFA
jgi:hypothetical protein